MNTSSETTSSSIKWAHATNSLAKLQKAIADPDITSIECDLMLGTNSLSGGTLKKEPILAHPPHRESDLTVAVFLELVTTKVKNNPRNNDETKQRALEKHIKLDFKEIEVLLPSLDLILSRFHCISNPFERVVTLNADILPGPGNRDTTPVPPSAFLETCLKFVKTFEESDMSFSFSLGYKCDYSSGEPYTADDVSAMSKLVRQFELMDVKNAGLVLALNARLLANDPVAFDPFLKEFPQSQILAWTGSGEPSITKSVVEDLVSTFAINGMKDRMGLDCDIVEG